MQYIHRQLGSLSLAKKVVASSVVNGFRALRATVWPAAASNGGSDHMPTATTPDVVLATPAPAAATHDRGQPWRLLSTDAYGVIRCSNGIGSISVSTNSIDISAVRLTRFLLPFPLCMAIRPASPQSSTAFLALPHCSSAQHAALTCPTPGHTNNRPEAFRGLGRRITSPAPLSMPATRSNAATLRTPLPASLRPALLPGSAALHHRFDPPTSPDTTTLSLTTIAHSADARAASPTSFSAILQEESLVGSRLTRVEDLQPRPAQPQQLRSRSRSRSSRGGRRSLSRPAQPQCWPSPAPALMCFVLCCLSMALTFPIEYFLLQRAASCRVSWLDAILGLPGRCQDLHDLIELTRFVRYVVLPACAASLGAGGAAFNNNIREAFMAHHHRTPVHMELAEHFAAAAAAYFNQRRGRASTSSGVGCGPHAAVMSQRGTTLNSNPYKQTLP